jgi:hypothetical protein
MVYYQQQNVALLAQISEQVSSIAPQVSIPSSPPPPYPDFTPNPSDVRVNAYWFMSLVFSLSAALLATLVQQWVRDYMQVFQRYGNPLKGARLRQYLYEGAEGWYMLVVAESVPGLVHVSLFLFFLGLIDSLFSLNTTISITTIVPITICGLFYILSTFAPILDSQSPFQTPLSSLIWYLTRKLRPRTYLDRAPGGLGAPKTLSSNMSDGRIQLAMEENEHRKHRDVRAMRWLIDNRTEDDEMDSFVVAIPGAFTSKWGVEVWRMVADTNEDEGANTTPNDATVRPRTDADLQVSALPHHNSPLPQHTLHLRSLLRFFGQSRTVNGIPHDVTVTRSISHVRSDPHATKGLVISDLCKRVRHLLDTCKSTSKESSSRKRARGCVETVASLVLCANVKLEPFGGLGRLLRELGEIEKIRELSAEGSNVSFVTCWACLYMVDVTRRDLDFASFAANMVIRRLSRFRLEEDGKQTNIDDTVEKALMISRRIDDCFETARQICVGLKGAFRDEEGRTEEQVREALARDHEADISKLESAIPVSDKMDFIDTSILRVNRRINRALLPGVSFDEFKRKGLIQPVQFFNISADDTQDFMPQIVFLTQRLRLLCSYAPKLHQIIKGGDDGVYRETLESLGILWKYDGHPRSVVGGRHLMERQLWRLLDLRDSRGFGFLVELFFLVLGQLLSMAPSQDTYSALYIGTFGAITSGWRQHKDCIGTQRVILNLICDIAVPNRGVITYRAYPEYITNELLVLLGNMVEGQSGSHIDDAIKAIKDDDFYYGFGFGAKMMKVLSPTRTPASSS